jgi:hypothetical protein
LSEIDPVGYVLSVNLNVPATAAVPSVLVDVEELPKSTVPFTLVVPVERAYVLPDPPVIVPPLLTLILTVPRFVASPRRKAPKLMLPPL